MSNSIPWLSSRRYRKPYLHNILRRERLNSFLKQRKSRRVTLVKAKSGQGKSILIADYLSNHPAPFLWINTDKSDINLKDFLRTIEEGLTYFIKNVSKHEISSVDDLLYLLEKVTEPLYIIFDDFQNISDSKEITRIMDTIIQNLPTNIYIYILTRSTPNISLSKLRSSQELLEIGEKDLKFTIDETARLFKDVFQLDLSENILVKLDNLMQGWITGYIFLIEKLSCMLDSDEQKSYVAAFLESGNREQFFEFFDSEIMENLTECEKDMLFALSPFDSFTMELGSNMGGTEGIKCLKKLIHNANFISSMDNSSDTYTFHPLFSDFLRLRFTALDSGKKIKLIKRAVPFFKKNNDVQNLIPVLIKLGDVEEAKRVFIDFAERVLDLTQHKKIRRLLTFFPLKDRTEDPLLNYYSALALNLERPFTTRQQLFNLLKYFMEKGDIDRQARIYSTLLANFFFYQESKDSIEEIVLKAANFLEAKGNEVSTEKKEILLSLLPLGKNWIGTNVEQSFENAMRAEETSFKLNNKEAFLCSRLVLARNYLQSGEFKATKKLLTQTWDMLENNHLDHPYAALLKFYTGDADFYRGDIHKAIQHVQEGLNISSPDFAFRPYLELNLILYNLYLNNIERAEELFESTRDTSTGENLYLKYYRVYLLQMLIAYRNKNWRRAEYYCNRLMDEGNESLLLTDYPYSFIALIEVSIALKNFETARALLSTVLNDISPETLPYPAATLKGLEILCNIREEKPISREAEELQKMVKEHGYKNLDICDPELLEEICSASGISVQEDFPRLKSINMVGELKKDHFDLDIFTFGNFRIFIKGKEVPPEKLLSQKRVMDLLKLLIIHRKNGIHKDTIYETFWPKYSYKSARDNLNTIIYRLRNIFGKENLFLSTDVSTIGFLPNVVRTDLDSFTKFCTLGNSALKEKDSGNAIEMYNEAIKLYKGDFLEGDLYSDFIRDERESLKRTYLGILFKLTKLYLGTGDYLQATETLKLFNQREPVYEPATRLFMITSALIGNRSTIPRIYDELEQQLREAYSISPDKKTSILKTRLLRGGTIPRELWQEEAFI